MCELNNIIKNSNDKSLIILDEPCHSTESISAISIVGSLINKLIKNNVIFVLSSHL